MKTVLVTGAGGLVGSATSEVFHKAGWNVLGLEADVRAHLFGTAGSVAGRMNELCKLEHFTPISVDLRDVKGMMSLYESEDVDAVVHTAGQPSHDYSMAQPFMDFGLNAGVTLSLLEHTRQNWPDAPFVFLSTNKVYGDYPSLLGYREESTRYTPLNPEVATLGFDEALPLDGTMHSLFGVSKLYADVATQEYGLYYGMPTACFRCGCITGSHHQGVELHGFLAYLAKCVRDGKHYTIYGHKGKQVRDNIHATDLARAILEFVEQPKVAAVYNMGGGPKNSISMQEAIAAFEYVFSKDLDYTYSKQARRGDHVWWVSNTIKFEADYPDWERWWSLDMILEGFA